MIQDVHLKSEFGAPSDPILAVISNGFQTKRLEPGIFQCGHWNFEMEALSAIDKHPEDIDWSAPNSYGVCDSLDQLKESETFQYYQNSSEKYCVSLVKISKSEQPKEGGWRMHKWGPYIGNQDPKCEYIADEPEIEELWTYRFLKVL